jgi:NAD(P)-dependent dehydrogenase (short-subunit alcohol dehydrogenase family)
MRTTFDGRSALVTGGGSGIGLALARRLVAMGARVVVADLDADAADRAAHDVAASSDGKGGNVVAQQLDVRDRDAVRAAIDQIVTREGHIDLMFNNAGISMGGPTHELTSAHWDLIIDTNLRGVVNGILGVYPTMIEQGHGHIINTASGAGLVAPPFVTAYAATKHAVVGLSTGLRPEAARHGVAVTVLCPGAVETPILDRIPTADLAATASQPVTARQYLAVVRQRPINVDDYARHALDAVHRNKAIVVVPRRAAALWYLHRLSPALTERLATIIARHVDEQLLRPGPSAHPIPTSPRNRLRDR